MKDRVVRIDRIICKIIQSPLHTSFTITELRKEYIRCMPEQSSISPTKIQRFIYKQLGRLVRLGWVSRSGAHMSRNIQYRVMELPKGIILKQTESLISQESQSELNICTHNAHHNSSRALHASSLHKIETTLSKVRMDFIATLGEAETYKVILAEHPYLRAKLENTYHLSRDKSSNLMGQLRALEQTVKILEEQL